MESPLLKVSNLTVKFSSLVAVNDVSLEVQAGDVAA